MAKQPRALKMLTHGQVWAALDRLAERAGLSASGLARRAGLDPTTFNKSKRVTGDGRERWPSTESLAKALAATDCSIETFVHLIGAPGRESQCLPLLSLAHVTGAGHFDAQGKPVGRALHEVTMPSIAEDHAFALEIAGNTLKPAYRDGDVIVVSPSAPIRRGDRVVVKLAEGEVVIGELKRRGARTLELAALNPDGPDRVLAIEEAAWTARIVWVRQ